MRKCGDTEQVGDTKIATHDDMALECLDTIITAYEANTGDSVNFCSDRISYNNKL
jgi:hypothetical protein